MLVEAAVLGLATIALVLARWRVNWRARTKGCSTPPSRPGWPILGNLLDLAAVLGTEWEAYMEWGKELGGLLSSSNHKLEADEQCRMKVAILSTSMAWASLLLCSIARKRRMPCSTKSLSYSLAGRCPCYTVLLQLTIAITKTSTTNGTTVRTSAKFPSTPCTPRVYA